MNRRLAYLDALGVDVWLERGVAPAAGAVPRAEAAVATAEVRSLAADELTAHRAGNAAPVRGAGAATLGWDDLAARVAGCTDCGLCETRTQTVFGVGNPQARWMIVGEAPGAEEDRRGEPFVGRAGQLLDAMLCAAGFERKDVFIANVLKCRPPNNRDPSNAEAAACGPYLARQIELVAPDIIVAVGRIAAQRLLESTDPLGKLRGRPHRLDSGVPVVVTYHPAYLLRSPSQKRKAWEDLLLAHRVAATRAEPT